MSTLYIKFDEKVNPKISKDNFDILLFKTETDYLAYDAGVPTADGLVEQSLKEFQVYMSHLIFTIDIETTEVNKGVIVLNLKNKMYLNNSLGNKFYPDTRIIVEGIDYYRSQSSFENLLGILFGIILGLSGIASLFIPSIKYMIMSQKIFQMNNYFFLINVNLPYNLFLFFNNI